MALRLKGSSSGYAEIDASADAGSVTLTLPATAGTINVKDGSGTTNVGTGVNLGNPGANIFTISNTGGERLRIAADGSVSIPGNLNISGVLTYEDVTSVDAIGLSTFRDGLITKDVGIATITSSDINGATAIDVFVYDTSKDSDGGAWRKRTKHTSWYNEEAAAGVRGSRKEFPAVAVIVLDDLTSTGKMTIYDGDDPDLPMWMVFTGGVSAQEMLPSYDGTKCSCLSALNGQICVGNNTYDLEIIDFIKDGGTRISNAGQYSSNHNISTRNSALGKSSYAFAAGIVNRAVNDVAMTVLPNALIDDATGLPVPTIAVATVGGISMIKDDGTTTNPGDASNTQKVSFKNTTTLVASVANNTIRVFDNVGALLSGSSQNRSYYTDSSSSSVPAFGGATINEPLIGDGGNSIFGVTNKNGATSDSALTFLSEKRVDQSNNMVVYASTSYNTGWMHGDCKGAFLSDTDDTDAVGGNLVVDGSANDAGDFNAQSDVDSWTASGGATLSLSSGKMRITSGSGQTGYAYKSFTTVVGKQYVFSTNLTYNSGTRNARLSGVSPTGTDIVDLGWDTSSANFYHVFTATSTTTYVAFGTNSGYSEVDNVVVTISEKDRSVNNNGLQVVGTINKTAVATGAELVSYSGFSGSNYLVQPNNSDLAPGTGAYSVSCWFKTSTSGSNDQYIFDRGTSGSASRNLILVMQTSGRIQFYHTRSDGTSSDLQTTDMPSFADNSWHQVVGLYDGSAYRVYVDGIASSVTNTTGRDVGNDGSPELTIGTRFNYTQTFGGDLALFRYSRSAPSAEQIKKMYEDEKVLFQENAKATLYGSSDAVTALAYDEVTDQLHVGTSSGRSDFQGLRRINNTTTAVSTAISAHDTFIIEQ